MLNIDDFEAAAREKMSQTAYDYYASGADDEITLRENRAAFQRLFLAYRVLRDASRVDTSRQLLGADLSMPILAAPSAFHQLAHPEGETATVRAVSAARSVTILSTLSNFPVEEVTAAGGPVWFQLYVYKDRGLTEALIQRVEAAGCQALVFTVDAPVLGKRERDVRNRFHLPAGFRMENVTAGGHGDLPEVAGSGLSAYFARLLDPALTWDDLDWLRARTRLPILVKGIVRGDDAVRAAAHGAAGVVVSNHGGRQLDTALPTIQALPEVAAALRAHGPVDGARPVVLLDGGVRRGTDVVKALALGADAVLLGRPILWGLAADGQAGVAAVLALLRSELETAMALCGCRNLAEIDADLVRGRGAILM